MWPFSKKTPGTPALTLKTRVSEFWDWYSENAEKFYSIVEAKKCGDLQDEVIAAVNRWLPGMAWVFGPGENNEGHSFTLSGEGVLVKQFVAEYWLSCAPKLTGWTFHAARPPCESVKGFKLELDGSHSFDTKELWLFPSVNEDNQKIDLTVWHPLFGSISDNSKWTALFLLLDDVLGEHGTQNWIGEIKFASDSLKESMPIWELREFVQTIESTRGWKKHKPTDTYTGYKINAQGEHLRGDMLYLTSRLGGTVLDYLENEGPIDHPLPNLGVDFVFVSIGRAVIPEGQEVDFRAKIEDDLIEVLAQNRSGDSLGGGTGTKNCYLDLITYDGDESIKQIQQVLRKHGLPKETSIRYLTKDKSDKVASI